MSKASQEADQLKSGGYGLGSSAHRYWCVSRTPWLVGSADQEATVKACGVTVAMLQGQSWAPNRSNGLKVNVGCAGINRHEERDENARHRRYSEPRWPRVMRRHPQGCRRSVDRGTYRSAIEPRNNSFGVPTPSHEAEGHIMSSAIASCFWTLRGLRPCACTESSCARTGRSHARPSVDHRAGRSGKAEAVSLR